MSLRARFLFGSLTVLAVLGLPAGEARAEEGNILSNIFKYGGTTVPPSQPKELEAAYCPNVDVSEGGAALQLFAGRPGDSSAIRTQITLGRLARECTRRQDGSITVKVGIEGRILLGPAGKPGRFDVPVTIQIKSNEAVIVTRFRKVAATIAAGEAQGFFSVIEDEMPVPAASSAEYEIVVGLGGAQAAKAAPRRRPRPPAASASAPAEAGAAGAAQ